MYQVLGSDQVRATRFADAMAVFASSRGFEVSHILENYNWNAVADGLVVDIGGSRGHVAISLAQRFKSLHVLVQDLEPVIAGASSLVPADLAPRVSFMAHDFFSEQPVEADVYYFRWIFHNWSDKYCIQILRYLIPVLKPGARVLVQDSCIPEPGDMAHWREKQLRHVLDDHVCAFRVPSFG
jgi:trans-aconitate methyltransferase